PPPGALRRLVTVGEELPADVCARWRRRFPEVPILNSYGPTECSDGVAHAALRSAGQIHNGRVPIGGPAPNTRLHVLDDELRPVPVGVPGELHIAGAGVARGYLSDPGRTACSFVPDPHSTRPGGRMYRTGDRVRRRADGWLEYLGRSDNQVKIRGQRVELDEVAALLRALPGVRDAAAAVHVDHAGRTRLVGYLVGATDIATARADAAAALPGHLLPSAYVPLEELPRTAHGKLDRAALPPPEQRGGTQDRAPRTAPERLLAELCADVLGVDRVGVGDNFFALGGDSISAIALSARCRSAGLDIAPHEIFQRKTVEALAATAPANSGSPARPAPPPRTSLMAAEAQRLRADYPDLCDVLPLSPLQEGFLYHALYQDSRADVYRIQVTADISGPLDPAALREAARALLNRHPNLRAGFVPHGLRHPVQVVPATAEPAWRDLQLPPLTDEERAARLRQLAREEFRRTFDVTRPPLLRCALAQISPQRHRLIVTSHHILFDGWSIPVLAQELLALCEKRDLGAPTTSYRDYLGWLAGQDRDAALAAWRGALDGLEHPTRLTQAATPEAAVFPETHTVELPERLTERLGALARAQGLTLNTVLQCCWAVLLGSLTGRRDVVFGATVAVRPTEIPDVDTLVGMCVNTVPVRIRLDPAESWLRLLARAQAEQAALTPYQFLDLAAIQQLAPAVGELFDTLLVLENIPFPDGAPQAPNGLRVDAVQVDSATHYPLCLSVFPGARLRLRLDYRPDAFSQGDAASIAERFSRLLRSLAGAPRQRIDQVTVLRPAERRRLLLENNDTAVETSELTASRLFERQAAATPDAAAVVSQDTTLTYRQLNARANRLARLLAERGAGPERVVAVGLPRSVETIVALLAVLKAGAAHLGLDLAAPIARARAILDDARPVLAVTDSTTADRLPDGPVPSVVLDQPDVVAALDGHPGGDLLDPELRAPVRGDNPGYVVYTSGSTGGPKGVVMPVRGLVNLLCWHTSSFRGGAGTRTAQFLSIGFDFAVEEILQALLAGKTLVTPPERTRRDFPELVDWIDCAKINELFAPTPVLDALLATAADRGSDLDSLTDLVQGGEQFRVSAELRAFCRKRRQRRAHNLYGPSETHVVSMATLPEEVDRWPEAAPIGLPVWNTTMYVVDSMLRPVPPGVAGELYVGGAQLARGYLNAPARTAERFVPDPFGPAGGRLYRTGDLVRWNSDCQLEFLGRVDDQVKVRGHRVEPGEVAGVLAQHPSVASAVVIPRENPAGDVDLVAYVVPAAGAPVEPHALRRHLRQRLPDYLTPAAFVALEELPLTPNGKVDRRALPRPADAARPVGRQPATRREAMLRRLYAEVLGAEAGVDDNFFDLGGNSLSATRLIGRVRAEFGLDLAIRTLMESPTPAELARRLGAAGDDFAPLLPLKPSGAGPPLFCVHPAAGLSWGYTALVGHMAAEHPLYGLQAPALNRRRRLCATMAEAAEDYVTRIRRAQPVGPYRLLGWSFGGVLAHEIAVRLQAAGQRVCSLLVLDSPWRLPAGELPDDQHVFTRLLLTAGHPRAELPSRPLSAAEAAAMLRDKDRPFTERRLLRIAEVYRNHVRLAQEFTPGTYRGRMVYFLATRGRTDPDRQAADWSRFATGDTDYHEVDCEHQQMMSPGPISRIGPIVASELRRSGPDPEWEEP
ncbi:MAG: amino acid adenylation domain-containing protein, partial [Micromonosporaceae bacterium]|nr:amino acid adenylation domain-containing protein [Micromonosporaceae bacterium]